MGRGLILWMVGIPLPIVLLLYVSAISAKLRLSRR